MIWIYILSGLLISLLIGTGIVFLTDKHWISYIISAIISIIIICASIEIYKYDYPNSTYKVVVTGKDSNYSNAFIYTDKFINEKIYVKNLNKWSKTNIGDTIYIQGYDNNYLRY